MPSDGLIRHAARRRLSPRGFAHKLALRLPTMMLPKPLA